MGQIRAEMRYALLSLLTVSIYGLVTCGGCLAAPAGWNLTWSDEFNGTSLDTNKWDASDWDVPFNDEQQAYRPDHVSVSGGNLVLRADEAENGVPSQDYTSGKVESKFTQQHGRWEIRAKLPSTKGTWPAIWLLPDTNQYSWPSKGEIDIMENRGNQPKLTSSAFHWGPDFEGRQFTYDEQQATNGGQAENYHNEFHTYAVEWDASKIRFFVDDVHYHTVSNEDTINGFYPGGFLAGQTAPVEINLNVAVGGGFLPPDQQPDGSSTWPQEMLVDYVRVYELDSTVPPAVFKNGSFEEQGGSLTNWSTFGNAIPNVQTHHEAAALDGSETLKLFGQFNGSINYSGVTQGVSVSPGDSLSASASALVRMVDDIVGGNTVEMKFEYYSEFGGEFGSSSYLGSSASTIIANAATANDAWVPHTILGTAPAGAAEARLSLVFVQTGNDGGAIHIDDVSFSNLNLAFNADTDNDGDVDGVDFLSWQRGLGFNDGTSVADGDFNYDGLVGAADLSVWETQFGANATVAAVQQVPEPSAIVIAVSSLLIPSMLRINTSPASSR